MIYLNKQQHKKTATLFITSILFLQKGFAQADSLVQNHNSETLWYLQKDTWLVGSLFFVIVLAGIFYRASKIKRNPTKKIITETHTVIKSEDDDVKIEKL